MKIEEQQKLRIYTIPNLFTSFNIICGVIAIILTLENKDYMIWSAAFIVLASVFDFLDGLIARLLHAYSPIGKDLDSLADMVSFGVAPGIIIYQLLKQSFFADVASQVSNDISQYVVIIFISAFIPVFSGLRLAKFNNDTRQSDSFIGLPTPANAILIASLPVILMYYEEITFIQNLLINIWFLLGLVIIESFLLVCEFPMFSLKFKNLSFKENKIRFIFLALSVLLIFIFQFGAVPLIIILFILLSFINLLIYKKK